MFQVEFYEKEDGDIPVEKFLNSLDIKMRNKILMILNVLQERGNQLREPYSCLLYTSSGRKRDRDHGGDRVQTGKGSGGVRVHGSV